MTKLVIAVFAALAIFAGPVLAGPTNDAPPTSYSGDFQMQGR
jgi:hypothetical protein